MAEIADALSAQIDYEHRRLIDPRTGEVAFWTSDTGIDGQNPVEIDELDLVPIDPLPPYVWYQDTVDFADGHQRRRGQAALQDGSAGPRRVSTLQESDL